MYTTREMQAEEGEAASAVAAFNQELQATTIRTTVNGDAKTLNDFLLEELQLAHTPGVTSLNFTTVPADSPELQHRLEEFAQMLERDKEELHNAWGVIIITQNQANLKRIDLFITWDEVKVEGGKPVKDDKGEPVLVLDKEGKPIRRINTKHIFIHQNAAYFSH
jgi:hypothetical protein